MATATLAPKIPSIELPESDGEKVDSPWHRAEINLLIESTNFDPDRQQLDGLHLMGRRYRPMRPDERGWLWSEQLELWLGTWEGEYQRDVATWLRFYDPKGRLITTAAEAERQRADVAEAEVKRLKARLTRKNGA